HLRNGFSCSFCRCGDRTTGDMDKAMSKAHGFVGKPKRTAIPALCAKCHSDANLMQKYKPQQRVDQFQEYKTSRHGKLLASGDEAVATCIDCHGAHGVREVKDAQSPVYPQRSEEHT